MCQDPVVPSFQKVPSPVFIPYLASALPPSQESRSFSLPGSHSLITKSIPEVISASPSPPHGAAVSHPPPHFLFHPIEWSGGRPTAAQMGLQACFSEAKPDLSAPTSRERWRQGQNLWYSDIGPVSPDSHSTTQKSMWTYEMVR